MSSRESYFARFFGGLSFPQWIQFRCQSNEYRLLEVREDGIYFELIFPHVIDLEFGGDPDGVQLRH